MVSGAESRRQDTILPYGGGEGGVRPVVGGALVQRQDSILPYGDGQGGGEAGGQRGGISKQDAILPYGHEEGGGEAGGRRGAGPEARNDLALRRRWGLGGSYGPCWAVITTQ